MIDLSGFRPFSLKPFADDLTPGIYQADQLIVACQVKHLGYVDGRPSSAGAKALAHWLIEHRDFIDRPKAGDHVLTCGTTIERVLAGEVLPEEAFAVALAEMTQGAVLPTMFGLPALCDAEFRDWKPSATGEKAPPPVANGKAPEAEAATPLTLPASAPSLSPPALALPPVGVLGGALPSGRLFHPIADTRLSSGFVLTGCGIALNLDESTATAMRDALNVGIDHLRAARAPRRVAA